MPEQLTKHTLDYLDILMFDVRGGHYCTCINYLLDTIVRIYSVVQQIYMIWFEKFAYDTETSLASVLSFN